MAFLRENVPYDPNAGLRRRVERLSLQEAQRPLEFSQRVYAYQDAKKQLGPRTFEEVQSLREQFGFGASQGWPQELEPGFYGRGEGATTGPSEELSARKARRALPTSPIPAPGRSNVALDVGTREARRGRVIRGEEGLLRELETGAASTGIDVPPARVTDVERRLPLGSEGRRRLVKGRTEELYRAGAPTIVQERKARIGELDNILRETRVEKAALRTQEKERKITVGKVKALVDLAISKSRTLGDYAIDTYGEIEEYLRGIYPKLDFSDPEIQRAIEKGVTPGAVDTSSRKFRSERREKRATELDLVPTKIGAKGEVTYGRGREKEKPTYFLNLPSPRDLSRGILKAYNKDTRNAMSKVLSIELLEQLIADKAQGINNTDDVNVAAIVNWFRKNNPGFFK